MEGVPRPWINSEKVTSRPSLKVKGCGVQGLPVCVVNQFDNSVDDMLSRADKQSANHGFLCYQWHVIGRRIDPHCCLFRQVQILGGERTSFFGTERFLLNL